MAKSKPFDKKATIRYNNYIIYDWETSGFSTSENAVTEIAAIVLDGKSLEEIIRYDNLIKPYNPNAIYDPDAAKSTGITKEMCEKDGISLDQLKEDLITLFEHAGGGGNIKGAGYFPVLVAHNAGFDSNWIQHVADLTEINLGSYIFGTKDPYGNFRPQAIDTVLEARKAWRTHSPGPDNYKLHTLCQYANIDVIDAHRAINDVEALANLFVYFQNLMNGSSGAAVASNSGKFRETFAM